MARVTALREQRGDRVAVELDGEPWRTLPSLAVVRAGLATGVELDRPRARLLRRELVRASALRRATRALARHDESAAAVTARLERAGVAPSVREDVIQTLERAGYVNDERAAAGRARVLAGRGAGDDAIRFDLDARGIAADAVERALGALEPERERARAVGAARGRSPATARYLARKGFSEDSIEDAVGAFVAEDQGPL